MKTDLGNRMKVYEAVFDLSLSRRTPLILRLDGKAFHTYTRGLDKPWDSDLHAAFVVAARALCAQAQGCKLAYLQSDEASFLLTDWDALDTQPWLGQRLQKLCSVAASIFTGVFAQERDDMGCPKCSRGLPPAFDCRAFTLPEAEVCNYFLWRQQDAERNSVSGLAQSLFSHKQLHCQGQRAMRAMLAEAGAPWESLPAIQRRGSCLTREAYEIETQDGKATRHRWSEDVEIPCFSEDRNYVERWLP